MIAQEQIWRACQDELHLEDGSVYRQVWWAKRYCTANFPVDGLIVGSTSRSSTARTVADDLRLRWDALQLGEASTGSATAKRVMLIHKYP